MTASYFPPHGTLGAHDRHGPSSLGNFSQGRKESVKKSYLKGKQEIRRQIASNTSFMAMGWGVRAIYERIGKKFYV